MLMKTFKFLFVTLLLLCSSVGLKAQCTFRNTAFNPGEFLTYNLYYNWKFVWVKAGSASMYVVRSNYHGTPAYRCSLTTRGNHRVDDFFVLRDTLLCYSSLEMAPLYFRKGAREGSRYYVDEVFYSYPNGRQHIRQHKLTAQHKNEWRQRTLNNCVYDMLNIFLRARSFEPLNWKKGHVVEFPIADGNNIDPAQLRFTGKTTIKGDNGVKYRCLRLSYYEREDGKWRHIVDFFISDDQNHVPIRLDMFLKFGSAKAFLVGLKGIRNPMTSIVR